MKKFLGLLLIFTTLVSHPALAQRRELNHDSAPARERRVALVIGNSAYAVGPLKNPVNDARAISRALSELGFEVIHKENLGREEMRGAIRQFGFKIRGGGVGLFYYAGHGVQIRGENYLVPTDAAPKSADEVDDDAVSVSYILEKMEVAGNDLNILILDACRNNPFTRSFRSGSDGLAVINAPTGTVISYATAINSVASDGGSSGNSVYTEELLRHMRTPGLSITQMFIRVTAGVHGKTQGRQTPWVSMSLTRDFYFNAGGRNTAGPVVSAEAEDAETGQWERIKNSSYPNDFAIYLQEYPRGKYADLARMRIQSLTPQTTSQPAPFNAGPTLTPTPTLPASGSIRFDGIYRSIKGEEVSWLRFYDSGSGVARGTTQVNAPEEVTRWLDGHTGNLTGGYRGTFSTAYNSNKFSITYNDSPLYFRLGRSIEEMMSDDLKSQKIVAGTVIDNSRLLLADTSEVYEFVKVELQPVGSGVSGRVELGASGLGEPALNGFKINITGAGSRQQVVPKVAERLRGLGAEVEVDFEASDRRAKYKTIVYKNGQKDVARRIANLIKDLVDVDFTQSAQSDLMKVNEFYIILRN
jgi:hypothetical protein